MARLQVRVYPAARRTEFCGWYGDLPKVKVAARPVDGSANDALIAFLARAFDLRPRQIHLLVGHASRTKRFELDGLGDDELAARIAELNPR